jgi:hypothetical protein
MEDPVFGTLRHIVGDLWQRSVTLDLFGETWELPMSVSIRKKGGIEQNQIEACREFSTNLRSVLRATESAIRERSNGKRTTPEGVFFPYMCSKPTFGVFFQSDVDEEHGLAAKFENGKLTQVGPQDIVL